MVVIWWWLDGWKGREMFFFVFIHSFTHSPKKVLNPLMAHEIEMVMWIKRKIIIEVQVAKPLRVIKRCFSHFSQWKYTKNHLLGFYSKHIPSYLKKSGWYEENVFLNQREFTFKDLLFGLVVLVKLILLLYIMMIMLCNTKMHTKKNDWTKRCIHEHLLRPRVEHICMMFNIKNAVKKVRLISSLMKMNSAAYYSSWSGDGTCNEMKL